MNREISAFVERYVKEIRNNNAAILQGRLLKKFRICGLEKFIEKHFRRIRVECR